MLRALSEDNQSPHTTTTRTNTTAQEEQRRQQEEQEAERSLWESSNHAAKAMVVPWMRATLREVALQAISHCLQASITTPTTEPFTDPPDAEDDDNNLSMGLQLELTQDDLDRVILPLCQTVAHAWANQLEHLHHGQAARWLRDLVRTELSLLFVTTTATGDEQQVPTTNPSLSDATVRATASTAATTTRHDDEPKEDQEDATVSVAVNPGSSSSSSSIPLIAIRKVLDSKSKGHSDKMNLPTTTPTLPTTTQQLQHDQNDEDDEQIHSQILHALEELNYCGQTGKTDWPYDWSTTIVPAAQNIASRLYPSSQKYRDHHDTHHLGDRSSTVRTTNQKKRDCIEQVTVRVAAAATVPKQSTMTTTGTTIDAGTTQTLAGVVDKTTLPATGAAQDTQSSSLFVVEECNAVDWLLQRKRKSVNHAIGGSESQRRQRPRRHHHPGQQPPAKDPPLAMGRPPSAISHEQWTWPEIRRSMTHDELKQCLHDFSASADEDEAEKTRHNETMGSKADGRNEALDNVETESDETSRPAAANDAATMSTISKPRFSGVLLGSLSEYGWYRAEEEGVVAQEETVQTQDHRALLRAQRRCIQQRLGNGDRVTGWDSDYGTARRMRASSKVVQTMMGTNRREQDGSSLLAGINKCYCLEADLAGGCTLLEVVAKTPSSSSSQQQEQQDKEERTLHAFDCVELIALDPDDSPTPDEIAP